MTFIVTVMTFMFMSMPSPCWGGINPMREQQNVNEFFFDCFFSLLTGHEMKMHATQCAPSEFNEKFAGKTFLWMFFFSFFSCCILCSVQLDKHRQHLYICFWYFSRRIIQPLAWLHAYVRTVHSLRIRLTLVKWHQCVPKLGCLDRFGWWKTKVNSKIKWKSYVGDYDINGMASRPMFFFFVPFFVLSVVRPETHFAICAHCINIWCFSQLFCCTDSCSDMRNVFFSSAKHEGATEKQAELTLFSFFFFNCRCKWIRNKY